MGVYWLEVDADSDVFCHITTCKLSFRDKVSWLHNNYKKPNLVLRVCCMRSEFGQDHKNPT